MRFLDTRTGQFIERDPETKYAILSHTWDPEKGEQTYEELKKIQQRYVGRSGGPESGTSFSPERNQDGPPPTAPPSQLLQDSPSVPASPPTASSFITPQIQPHARTSVRAPVDSDTPSLDDLARSANHPSAPQNYPPESRANDRPARPSNNPPVPPPELQSKAHDPPLVTMPLMTRSTPSKSWFTRRLAQLRRWSRRCSAGHGAPPIQTDPHISVHMHVDAPTSADPPGVLLSDDPPAPSSDNPPVPSSNNPPASLSDDPLISPSSSTPIPLVQYQSKPSPQSIWDDPDLSPKIRDACAIARKNGYRYIWIDSCCIDKSSSSELSEAINSMYAWYALADVCYAYLADVPPGNDHQAQGSHFRESRWFTRGWTLQELIAPRLVDFLAGDWTPIGSKQALVNLIGSITGINYKALLHLKPLEEFSVAQRLSWAANRKTTRTEDRAYSLLGIFDIHMPTLYGEGHRAFRRLQEQIMQRIPDQSLFAWGRVYSTMGSQLRLVDVPDAPSSTYFSTHRRFGKSRRFPFAQSPDDFESSGNIRVLHHDSTHPIQSPATSSLNRHEIEYTSTPYGIRTTFQMVPLTPELLVGKLLRLSEGTLEVRPEESWYLAILGCEHAERPGHLLGRVCYIPPSEPGIEVVCFGSIFGPFERQGKGPASPNLFPLSPETIEHSRLNTELKTVFISHPDHIDLASTLAHKPQAAIQFVLLTETTETLCSRGYSANLQDPVPVPDHPTTQWLTLSKDNSEHTIAIEFHHTLLGQGYLLTIDADVELLGSRLQLDSAPSDSHQATRRTVSWRHGYPWRQSELHHEAVSLSAPGVGTLDVELKLEFAGAGVYFLHIDVSATRPLHP